jgi:hypothetical protein
MLDSPQVSRVPNTQIECTSFQRLCTSLSRHRGFGILGLRCFCKILGMHAVPRAGSRCLRMWRGGRCDRTTSGMRGSSPKITLGDSR